MRWPAQPIRIVCGERGEIKFTPPRTIEWLLSRDSAATMQCNELTAFLKVFRRGPQRDISRRVVAVHVDKPRKDEAAGGEARSMGKERRRQVLGR